MHTSQPDKSLCSCEDCVSRADEESGRRRRRKRGEVSRDRSLFLCLDSFCPNLLLGALFDDVAFRLQGRIDTEHQFHQYIDVSFISSLDPLLNTPLLWQDEPMCVCMLC